MIKIRRLFNNYSTPARIHIGLSNIVLFYLYFFLPDSNTHITFLEKYMAVVRHFCELKYTFIVLYLHGNRLLYWYAFVVIHEFFDYSVWIIVLNLHPNNIASFFLLWTSSTSVILNIMFFMFRFLNSHCYLYKIFFLKSWRRLKVFPVKNITGIRRHRQWFRSMFRHLLRMVCRVVSVSDVSFCIGPTEKMLKYRFHGNVPVWSQIKRN